MELIAILKQMVLVVTVTAMISAGTLYKMNKGKRSARLHSLASWSVYNS